MTTADQKNEVETLMVSRYGPVDARDIPERVQEAITHMLWRGYQVKIRTAGDGKGTRVDLRREGEDPAAFAYHENWQIALLGAVSKL